ncbi:ATP-binding protein [Bacillus sp. B15-48]|uniref:ATP-binding protein n=1 Tax=Bacillus sp. B15-48 TaxID=1548601 RepID=UPI00193F856B|nr:ATP-binding protein [Bacillus sp. B15-48]MBM4763267.1 ATP-binding protein [Bacillus sp. B15-48]
MRDVLYIPFNQDETIVIACDNSGAIGKKDKDAVKVPYDVVAYFSFRVAAMECIAAGGEPFAVTLQNFCEEDAWLDLIAGIKKGLIELSIENIEITGSTESNFQLNQSAISLTILGKKKRKKDQAPLVYSEQTKIAVIGSPLVGNEVVDEAFKVVPLSLFKKLSLIEDVIILPVGSKGILYELNQLFYNRTFSLTQLESDLNLLKSAGPATCFIVVYEQEKESVIASLSDFYFHEVNVGCGYNA